MVLVIGKGEKRKDYYTSTFNKVNKMAKVNVNKHTRKIKGKIHRVKSHKRRKRKLGKIVKFRKIGTFSVGLDEQGNIRGSKVILSPSAKKARLKRTKVKRRRKLESYSSTEKLDSDYYNGLIDYNQWSNARERLMGLN